MYGPPNVRGVNYAALTNNAPEGDSVPTGTKYLQVIPATSRVVRGTCTDDGTQDAPLVIAGYDFSGQATEDGTAAAYATYLAGAIQARIDDEMASNIVSVTDNGDGTFDITCEPGAAANGLEFSSTDPNLTFVDWVKVSGAGTAAANGTYSPRGMNAGEVYWNLVGEADSFLFGGIIYGFEDAGRYAISDLGGSTLYNQSGAATSPLDVSFLAASGTSPAPTVSLTGSDAVTQSITRDVLLGYKVYRALLTQSGTDAPVATVKEDSTGLTLTWGYTNGGLYVLDFGTTLPESRVSYSIPGNVDNGGQGSTPFPVCVFSGGGNPGEINSYLLMVGTGDDTGFDGTLTNFPFELVIYPE